MTKTQFTISKLNKLKSNLQQIVAYMDNALEINSKLPHEFEEKYIMIPCLEKQKELYLNIIGNIENIISNFDKIEDKDSPYSNHLLLQTFNIMDFIGKPNDIHDYCLSFKGEDYFDE